MSDLLRFTNQSADHGPNGGNRDALQRDQLRGDTSHRRATLESPAERELRERAAAFARTLGRKQTETGLEQEPPESRQLLALLERATNPFALLTATTAPTSTGESSSARTAEQISQRVEAALAAEARSAAIATTRITVPVVGSSFGSVVIDISADGIDVTLVRAANAVEGVLRDDARDLAERLQSRLRKGRVRIFETLETALSPATARPSAAIPEGDA